jgi:hypothetical protein
MENARGQLLDDVGGGGGVRKKRTCVLKALKSLLHFSILPIINLRKTLLEREREVIDYVPLKLYSWSTRAQIGRALYFRNFSL